MIRTNSLESQDSKQKWLCSACTFKNHPGVLSCEICNTHKEGIPADDHADGRNDPIGFKCHNCKFELQKLVNTCPKCKEVLIPQEDSEEEEISKKSLKVLDPEKQITKMKGCPTCGEMNDLLNDTCVFCQEDFEIKEQPLIPIKKRARKYKAPRPFRGFSGYSAVGYASCKYCHMQCLADQIQDHEDGCIRQSNEDLQTKYLLVPKTSCHFCYKKTKPEEYMEHEKNCSQLKSFFDSESPTFKRCTKLQIDTMFYMHKKSQKKHWIMEKALVKRIQKLGYKAEQLENLHHYIVNYAPIIIHMHASQHMQFFVKDTHYRNQFQTRKSSGSLSSSSRISWEDRMFDRKHHNATPFERVKYGTINFTNDPKGVRACVGYGNSYFLLKPHVRNRCTVTDMDSSSPAATIATFQFSYHLLMKLSDDQLKAAFDGSKANQVQSTMIGTYKEIQIHGPVEFKQDIERVYINKNQIGDPKILQMVKEFCKNNQLKYQLFGEEPPKIGAVGGFDGGLISGFSGGFGGGFGGAGLLPPPVHHSLFSFGAHHSYPAGAGAFLFGPPMVPPPQKEPQQGVDYI